MEEKEKLNYFIINKEWIVHESPLFKEIYKDYPEHNRTYLTSLSKLNPEINDLSNNALDSLIFLCKEKWIEPELNIIYNKDDIEIEITFIILDPSIDRTNFNETYKHSTDFTFTTNSLVYTKLHNLFIKNKIPFEMAASYSYNYSGEK